MVIESKVIGTFIRDRFGKCMRTRLLVSLTGEWINKEDSFADSNLFRQPISTGIVLELMVRDSKFGALIWGSFSREGTQKLLTLTSINPHSFGKLILMMLLIARSFS